MLVINDEFETSIQNDFVSPYELAKVINKFVTKAIPTQMMYNYVRNNLIPTTLVGDRNMIERTVAIAFVQKFVLKRNSAVSK